MLVSRAVMTSRRRWNNVVYQLGCFFVVVFFLKILKMDNSVFLVNGITKKLGQRSHAFVSMH